ncbi:SusC/RagA family TonB-linked outer membrane protein [Prolixibacteraceae bacterium JC049]|nr:SusC/RagA family TonB-linked outer membrane protein [Prolixibacteraceae bacterium JC049]
MKKNLQVTSRMKTVVSKTMLIMRLTLYLVLLSVISSVANTYSQNARLTVKMKNSRMSEVFDNIEEQSDFYFFYNRNMFDDNHRVSVNYSGDNINEVLKQIFVDQNVKYEIVDKNIIIKAKASKLKNAGKQDKKVITGTVKDKDGDPLPGVSIVVAGTTNGVITTPDGTFSITNVASDAKLVFSFVGMKPQQVSVDGQNRFDIVLEEDAIGLEEVIAVGYQTKTKKNLTGSVATVDTKLIENRPTARVSELLSGTAPGLTITRNDPGRIGQSDFGIRIGGLVSRSGSSPLVVIDGIPQESVQALNRLNSNDIESMSILKDAEAAVYGSRAAGGVIVIQTKRGGEKPEVRFGYNRRVAVPHIYRDITNMFQMLEMQKEGWAANNVSFFGYPGLFKYIEDNQLTFDKVKNNDFKYVYGADKEGTWAPFPDTPFLAFGHTDWMEEMYGNATSDSYDVSVSGASKKLNYYTSLGVVNEKSMLRYGKNKSQTIFTRAKLEYKHSDRLKVGTNLSMRYQKWDEPTLYGAMRNQVATKFTWDHAYNPDGNYMNWGGMQSPIGMVEKGGDVTRKYFNLQAQIFVDFKLLDNLTLNANVVKGANFTNVRSIHKDFQHYYWNGKPSFTHLRGNPTQVEAHNALSQNFTGNFTAKYVQQFADVHTVRALAGYAHEEFSYDLTKAWRKNMLSTSLSTLNLGNSEDQYNSDSQWEEAVKSIFANLSYSYKDRYFIEGNYRNDGSSRFAKGYKWKDFYSVSGAWNITEELFVQNLGIDNILNNLKFRVSWAQLGNKAGIKRYDFVQQVNIRESNILLGVPGSVSKAQIATISGFPALDRTWEIAEKLNFGIDADLLGARLNVVANVFETNNKDIFYTEEFPSILGATPPSINGAHVKTTGWDLGIKWNDRLDNGLAYNIGFGISDANTKVIKLADSRTIKYGGNSFVEGYAVGTVFGFEYDGIISNEEELAEYRKNIDRSPWALTKQLTVGDVRYKDLDGDGRIEASKYEVGEDGKPTASSGDMVSLGDTERHYEYFINGGLSFKGFDFSFVLNGVGKWTVFDQGGTSTGYPWVQPLKHFYNNTWTPEHQDRFYPRISVISTDFSNHRNNNNYGLSNARHVRRSVPYLAVKNIQIGYTIPKQLTEKIGLSKVYVYANGSDLGYLINNVPDSYSPEQPFNASLTPYPRTFSLGVNINF